MSGGIPTKGPQSPDRPSYQRTSITIIIDDPAFPATPPLSRAVPTPGRNEARPSIQDPRRVFMTVTQLSPAPQAREAAKHNGARNRRGNNAENRNNTEDDVLIPVTGIVDVLDNYAFVRTSGYLAGPNDVYVSMTQIKRYGLRRGDAVTGAVRAARDNDSGTSSGRRDKYNPLVRLDTINGMDPEEARRRPEFYKLTPLYPQERLRLETEPHILTTRLIDLVMPIGNRQRAVIFSPPKAGKTMVLQAIAHAIATNNPEVHLMVVL